MFSLPGKFVLIASHVMASTVSWLLHVFRMNFVHSIILKHVLTFATRANLSADPNVVSLIRLLVTMTNNSSNLLQL